MSAYRIRIFSSFCDSDNCKNVYERLCEVKNMDNYGPDKDIYITTGDDYTHVIIMNVAMPDISPSVPKENVIGIAFEPPVFLMSDSRFNQFLEYAKRYISKYYIGSTDRLPAPFVENYSFMWHITPPELNIVNQFSFNMPPSGAELNGLDRLLSASSMRKGIKKSNKMSIMVSDKTQAQGHAYRHALVNEILKSDLDIHIYGRGCRFYNSVNDSRIKGEFTDNEPYETYQFHICIENFQTPCYVSEKYTNCVLWGTTPIYWGATEIDSMFPEITVKLSGDVSRDMSMIRSIINESETYFEMNAFSQDEIRPKINILKNLDNIFSVSNI